MPWITELTVAGPKFIFINADGFKGKLFVERDCSATWDLKVRRSANTFRRLEYFNASYLRTSSYNTRSRMLLQAAKQQRRHEYESNSKMAEGLYEMAPACSIDFG
jgi:hypothetical protein